MFVGDELMLEMSFTSARAGLQSLTHGGLLLSASDDAYDEGLTGLIRVGPAGISRLVRVQFCELTERNNCAGLAVRWEVSGSAGALFPVLDADLELIRAGPQTTWLTLAGAYRPPLGSLGAALDRAILHRVASATVRGFLKRVAAEITGQPDRADAATAGVPPDPPAAPGEP